LKSKLTDWILPL